VLLTSIKKLLKDTDAVSNMVEFILISGIAILFFVMITLSSSEIFIEGAGKTVAMQRFGDIGNDISTRVVDFYIVAPDNGTLTTDLTMPRSAGGHDYEVDANIVDVADQRITVRSQRSPNLEVSITINGIAHTVAIRGTTLSGNPDHELSFDSNL